VYIAPPYYGGYYGAWGYYDNDWMWGMAIGTTMMIGAVAIAESDDDDDHEHTTTTTTTTINNTTTPQGGLPCVPVIKEQGGMTYYQCGQQHYVLAYGGTGPIYIPVPAPGTPAEPPASPAPPPG
jgi:hypothetical protein